jgi:hypothetical protein
VTEAPAKEPNLLEKAKLIADLAAAWQNEELAEIVKRMPNGDKVLEIFQGAINREMQMVMSGNRIEENVKQIQALGGQVDKMGAAMSSFHNMILAFMNSPLVKVLDLMNQNLGARGHQFPQQPNGQAPQQPQRQQPMPQVNNTDEVDDSQPPGQRRATGLGSF